MIDVEMAWEYRRDEKGRVTGFTTVIADVTGRTSALGQAETVESS